MQAITTITVIDPTPTKKETEEFLLAMAELYQDGREYELDHMEEEGMKNNV